MRKLLLLALLGLGTVVQTQSSTAQTPYDYPWCALRGDRSGAQSCYYTSYGQCTASLRGVGGPAFAIRIRSAGRAGRAIAGRIATEAPPRLAQHLPATVS